MSLGGEVQTPPKIDDIVCEQLLYCKNKKNKKNKKGESPLEDLEERYHSGPYLLIQLS